MFDFLAVETAVGSALFDFLAVETAVGSALFDFLAVETAVFVCVDAISTAVLSAISTAVLSISARRPYWAVLLAVLEA